MRNREVFPDITREQRIAALEIKLGVWAEETGHAFDAAGRVDDVAAAAILGLSKGTLANWRATDSPLPFYKGRPPTYSLHDLAVYIDSKRVDHHATSRSDIATAGKSRNP